MSRSQRLLSLLEILRRHRFPVPGASLAEELGITLRTLYRDIGTLREQGANIEGAAGLGFILHPGFTLPPLMFTQEELEALALGSRWVARRADDRLGLAARHALHKIAAVLPQALRDELEASTLLVGPGAKLPTAIDEPLIRTAIKAERKALVCYRDQHGRESSRTVWPFALGYFDDCRVLAVWCERRDAFRHLRLDRILAFEALPQRYPHRRQALLRDWRKQQGIAAQ